MIRREVNFSKKSKGCFKSTTLLMFEMPSCMHFKTKCQGLEAMKSLMLKKWIKKKFHWQNMNKAKAMNLLRKIRKLISFYFVLTAT